MFAICFQNKHVFWACGEKKGEGDLKENNRRVFSVIFGFITNANYCHKVMIEGLMNNSFEEFFLKP